jgi:SAM-dependent methyltransferase
MTFMLADGGARLNVEDQLKSIGGMDDKNKESLKYVFGNTFNDKCMKFDIISSQFVLHYMLKDDTTFGNLCDNINRLLKSSGYLVFTTMDGDMMHKEFKKNDGKIESYYTDREGKKQKFLGINAKYDLSQDINRTGIAIDMFNASFMEEGTSFIEYVIPSKFIIEKFKEKCNLELVEEENFGNIYHIFEKFFKETAIYEEELRTRKYFEETSQYYDLKDEVNRASFELTRLSKVYVFQKRDKKFESKMKRTTKKN